MLGGACSQRGHRASGSGASYYALAFTAAGMGAGVEHNLALPDLRRGSCTRRHKARV